MNFSDISKIFSELRKLNENKEELREKLRSKIVEGTAGGDFVVVKANLLGEIIKINISEELFNMNDKKMIEDLCLAAVNDALNKTKKEMVNEIGDLPDSIKSFFYDSFNF